MKQDNNKNNSFSVHININFTDVTLDSTEPEPEVNLVGQALMLSASSPFADLRLRERSTRLVDGLIRTCAVLRSCINCFSLLCPSASCTATTAAFWTFDPALYPGSPGFKSQYEDPLSKFSWVFLVCPNKCGYSTWNWVTFFSSPPINYSLIVLPLDCL
jgi:hypothetical protein